MNNLRYSAIRGKASGPHRRGKQICADADLYRSAGPTNVRPPISSRCWRSKASAPKSCAPRAHL